MSIRTSPGARRTGYLLGNEKLGVDTEQISDYRSLILPEKLPGKSYLFSDSGYLSFGKMINPRKRNRGLNIYLPKETLFHHQVLIAPTQTGKTFGVIIPYILHLIKRNVRVIVNDPKGDLVSLLKKESLRLTGHSIENLDVWNPFNQDQSDCWNPIDEVKSIEDEETLDRMVLALIGKSESEGTQNRTFVDRDKRWLKGLIKLSILLTEAEEDEGASFFDIYSEMLSVPKNIERFLSIYKDVYGSNFFKLNDLVDFIKEGNTLVLQDLLSKLEWLTYKDARNITSHSDFNLSEIIETPGVLVIGNSRRRGEQANAAAALMYAMLRGVSTQRVNKEFVTPNAWIIDEAAGIAPRIDLAEIHSIIASSKVGILMALQSIEQLGEKKEEQEKYLSNCATKIFLRNVSSSTAEYLSDLLGTTNRLIHTKNNKRQLFSGGDTTFSSSNQTVRLLGKTEISRMPESFGKYCGIIYSEVLPQPFLVDFER